MKVQVKKFSLAYAVLSDNEIKEVFMINKEI
jgi:hypothetical protein